MHRGHVDDLPVFLSPEIGGGRTSESKRSSKVGFEDLGPLAAGDPNRGFIIREQTNPNFVQTTLPYEYRIAFDSGLSKLNNDFGNFERMTLSGTKFEDVNGNGVWDQGLGEGTLPGVAIQFELQKPPEFTQQGHLSGRAIARDGNAWLAEE